MEKIQALWARFKVQVSFVAGCLVVATSMGTCSFDPEATTEEAVATTETSLDVSALDAAVVETVVAINDAVVVTSTVLTEGDTELTAETTSTDVSE